jgi:carboxypeptidase family protein
VRSRTFGWIVLGVIVVAGNTGLVLWLKGRPRSATASLPGGFNPASLRETRAATRAPTAEEAALLAAPGSPAAAAGPRLAVVVVDAAGAPVAGASVRAEGARRAVASPIHEPPFGEGTTGADGTCDLVLSRRARTRVVVEKEGFARGEASVEGPRARVVLGPSGRVRGRVVEDGSGAPVPGAVVRAGRDTAASSETRTTEDGTFVLRGLRPGRRRLEALTDLHQPATADVEVAAGGEALVEIRLRRGFAIRGRVIFQGVDREVREGTVSWREEYAFGAPVEGAPVRTAAIGPDGRFVLGGLPGPVQAFLVTTGGVPYRARGQRCVLDPATGEQVGEIQVALPANNAGGLEYQGVVRDEEGRPVAGARVLVGAHVLQQVHNRDRGPGGGVGDQAATDGEGRYGIRAEWGGGEILVLHPDFAPTHFVLPPRSRDRRFDLVLRRGVPLVVEVRDAARRPAAGAEVYTFMIHSDPRTGYFQYGDVAESVRAHPVTDGEGRAVISHMAAGAWYVAARSAGGLEGARALLEFDGKAAAMDLALRRLPSVSGRVTDGSGAPVAGKPVLVAGPDLGGEYVRTETGSDGRFSFPAVFATPAWEQAGAVPLDFVHFRPAAGEGTASVPLDGRETEVVVEPR